MWFGAGFFSIRRMARRIAPLLISLRGAARKVPNFAQPIILAYETYASAKISRISRRNLLLTKPITHHMDSTSITELP